MRSPLARFYPWLVIFWGMAIWQSEFAVESVIVCCGMAWLFWKFDRLFR